MLQIYEFISFVQSKSTKKTEKKWSKKRTYLSALCKRLIITNWRWTTSREALSFFAELEGENEGKKQHLFSHYPTLQPYSTHAISQNHHSNEGLTTRTKAALLCFNPNRSLDTEQISLDCWADGGLWVRRRSGPCRELTRNKMPTRKRKMAGSYLLYNELHYNGLMTNLGSTSLFAMQRVLVPQKPTTPCTFYEYRELLFGIKRLSRSILMISI